VPEPRTIHPKELSADHICKIIYSRKDPAVCGCPQPLENMARPGGTGYLRCGFKASSGWLPDVAAITTVELPLVSDTRRVA